MTTNFEIIDNYAVLYEGYHIDLHNNFQLKSIHYDTQAQQVIIAFGQGKGEWIPQNELAEVILICENTNYFYLSNSELSVYSEDSNTLVEITFFPSSDRETNDCIIWGQQAPATDDDLLLSFQNEMIVRIGCSHVNCHITL